MMYKITITELFNSTEVNAEKSTVEVVRYEQTVDYINMHAVINAVNSSPRQRAQRSDAGKPRPPRKEEETV